MRHPRLVAMAGAGALVLATWTGSAAAAAPSTAAAPTSTGADEAAGYIVLAKEGASAEVLAAELRAQGATVTSVNAAVGMVVVSEAGDGFLEAARGLADVQGAARNGVIGQAPDDKVAADDVLKEHQAEAAAAATAAPAIPPGPGDPLDPLLWGMDMMQVPQAHDVTLGDRRVLVGVMDTGIDASHPDLAANFDANLSRNFTTDMPDIDGPCETSDCIDPNNVDDNDHGTHVAGTIAAAMNGMGVSGVAPNVTLVNVRAGQDSGYFFVGPTVNALTYAADAGLDVVNMSFYVDPWLYNCTGGAPEDSPEAAAEQQTIITAMNRALKYANTGNVTLVGALGNNHEDLSNPRVDTSSPDFPDGVAYPRTIDNDSCVDLPVEGPHVLGISSVGPSGTKADYSNYATDVGSGELEFSAPGGWFRDGFGTESYRTNENLILSAAPLAVLQDLGQVDEDGNITELGEVLGVQKDCTDNPAPGASNCGYYQYLQGTSMAAPHATGVVALLISQKGKVNGRTGFGMSPQQVRGKLLNTVVAHACPEGGVQSYVQEGRPAEYTAQCTGNTRHNAIYGWGIVNALNVVQR